MIHPRCFGMLCLGLWLSTTAWAQTLVARKITDPADLARGKGALGQVGDYLLANDKIRVILDAVEKRQGFAESGGNIVDAVRRDANVDLLSQLITYFDNTFPRQALYDRMEILKNGSDGQEARIRSSGVEMRNRKIKVSTDYSLRLGQPYVLVHTTLTNSSAETLDDFEVGDAVQWGYTEHFAPGVGHNLAGRNIANVDWLAGWGEGVSYGYTVPSGTFFGPNGSNWSDTNVSRVALKPNVPVSYARYLVVGTGDIASVTEHVYALRKQATGTLTGKVTEEGTGTLVPNAVVNVQSSEGTPYNLLKLRPDGSFEALLPPGRYGLVPSAIGRAAPRPALVSVREGRTASALITVGRPGHVKFECVDVTGQPIPAKITFKGLGDTPDPYLGPEHKASGARNVIFNRAGSGESLIPPGFYDVTVSRGIEYTTYRERVSIKPGTTAAVTATLKKVVDTAGFISGDFHLHSEYSFDSSVTLRDKVIGLVAEGVEFAVSSDHNYLADYKSAIKELSLERELKSSIGDEVTSSGIIHFNVFPLDIHTDRPRNGAIDPANMMVQEMINAVRADPGEEIVQLNHPRAGNLGYFSNTKFDSKSLRSAYANFSLDFDAIEIFNGKYVAEAEEVMRDWFNLLNAGYKITATGNSDSHRLVSEEAGYPRNFIFLGKDDPSRVTEDEVVAAIKAHKILVTNGPFPIVLAEGKFAVGDSFGSKGKPVTFTVRLQSAPWIDISQVTLVGNGEAVESRLVPEMNEVDKGTVVFTVTPTVDTWYVVVVRGNRSLAPVVPSLREREILPFAFTNPIWVDADGDAKFTPLHAKKR